MAGSWDVGPGAGGGAWDTPASPGVQPSSSGSPSPVSGSTRVVSRPPVLWLAAGLAAALVGLLLPVLSQALGVTILGWVLGGLVAIGLLGAFLWKDLERRSRGMAADSAASDWLRRGLVVAAVLAVLVNAWFIADSLARREW